MKNIINILLIILVFSACTTSNDKSENTQEAQEVLTDRKKSVEEQNKVIAKFSDEDKEVFAQLMKYAKENNLSKQPTADIEIEVAKQLLDIPYVAHTLESTGDEQLVVNLKGLDCTTFVENVVALSQLIKSGNSDFGKYCKNLTAIRYRNGKINKYPSRLHYFTDWLLNNEKKGIIEIISNKYGNADFNSEVYYMSKHNNKYKKLKDKPEFVKLISKSEKQISAAKLKYFTPEGLKQNIDKIQNGDIVAFSTSIGGLDISHVAIAYFKGKDLHFYHASSSKKKVVLSENTMIDYLKKIKHNNGVLIARMTE